MILFEFIFLPYVIGVVMAAIFGTYDDAHSFFVQTLIWFLPGYLVQIAFYGVMIIIGRILYPEPPDPYPGWVKNRRYHEEHITLWDCDKYRCCSFYKCVVCIHDGAQVEDCYFEHCIILGQLNESNDLAAYNVHSAEGRADLNYTLANIPESRLLIN